MKFTIINIANKMPKWVETACDEYLSRINHGKYSCSFIELKADKNTYKSAEENMAIEAKKIEAAIPKNSYIIAFDERGKQYQSPELANQIDKISHNYSHITFIIGGADGIDATLKNKANEQISLSKMVFPHALVRVIAAEQIYRAISILENHPYHRE